MHELVFASLQERPDLKTEAAAWFHDERWGVPKQAYVECMDAYLDSETPYGRTDEPSTLRMYVHR